MKHKKKITLIIVLLCIFAVILFLQMDEDNWICDNGQWIKHGNPSMAHPEVGCDQSGVEDQDSDIVLEYPKIGQEISSPLEIRGSARGSWYFEGDFPIVLTNWDGLIIAETYATAQGEWMTDDFVPFIAVLKFESDTSVSSRGSLILQKDNPSGLPEYDDALEISILF